MSLGTQSLTVFLKMAGDPVAVVRSRAPGKQISESERRSIADNLRREQDAITAARIDGTFARLRDGLA